MNIKIPFYKIDTQITELQQELSAVFQKVIISGKFIQGKELGRFEKTFANYCGVQHCVGVASGFDALHLTLRGLGIGKGDEVIVPANTYIATWLAVSATGAKPIPVEPDISTFNINPELIARAVSSKTKAIIPVHMYGHPADMDAISKIAAQFNFKVIEDGAHAHGALYKGNPVGCLAHAAAFSFYPSKNLGAFGDGGCVVTDNPQLAEQVRVLGNYGSRSKYHNEIKGFNSRLDELQAAFLNLKLRKLNAWNNNRAEIASRYLKLLGAHEDLIVPIEQPWCKHVWHQFVIRAKKRDELIKYLRSAGIETLIHYPVPPHLSEAYRDAGWSAGSFPITELLASEVLSLPIYPGLRDDHQYIIAATIADFYRQ